jgi:hypothetical protein
MYYIHTHGVCIYKMNEENYILKSYRLPRETTDFLKTQENASQYIREAIILKRLQEQPVTKDEKIIQLREKISVIQQSIKDKLKSPEYLENNRTFGYLLFLKMIKNQFENPPENLGQAMSFPEFSKTISRNYPLSANDSYTINQKSTLLFEISKHGSPTFEVLIDRTFIEIIMDKNSIPDDVKEENIPEYFDFIIHQYTFYTSKLYNAFSKQLSMIEVFKTLEFNLSVKKTISDAFENKVKQLENDKQNIEREILALQTNNV